MGKIKINLEVANALIWAAVIIACSLLVEDNGTIFNILLAGATLSFLWVDALVHKRKMQCPKK